MPYRRYAQKYNVRFSIIYASQRPIYAVLRQCKNQAALSYNIVAAQKEHPDKHDRAIEQQHPRDLHLAFILRIYILS